MPTRWPIFKDVTPAPRASTRPTISCPGMMGYLMSGNSPSSTCRSVRQTPQAETATRAWSGPGSGSGRSTKASLSPAACRIIAFIARSWRYSAFRESRLACYFMGRPIGERSMKIDVSKFQVPEGETVHLRKWPTLVKPVYRSKKNYEALLADHAARLCEQQKLLYASNSDALLVIFQAMDAAGKDGAIAHVMSGVNPQGCRVYSYKHPSAEELAHDFLWRTTRDMP